MPKLKFFGNKNKYREEPDEINEIMVFDNTDKEEIIAVISAAISAFLKKPVSGFRVVSFKKRGNWSNI